MNAVRRGGRVVALARPVQLAVAQPTLVCVRSAAVAIPHMAVGSSRAAGAASLVLASCLGWSLCPSATAAEEAPAPVHCTFSESKGWSLEEDGLVSVRKGAGDLHSREVGDSGVLTWTLQVSGTDRVLLGAARPKDGTRLWGAWVRVPEAGRCVRIVCDLDAQRLFVLEGESENRLTKFKEGRLDKSSARLTVSGAPGTAVRLLPTTQGKALMPEHKPEQESDMPQDVQKWMLEASKWREQMKTEKAALSKEVDRLKGTVQAASKREEELNVAVKEGSAKVEEARKAHDHALQALEVARVEAAKHEAQLQDAAAKATETAKKEISVLERKEAQAKAERDSLSKKHEESVKTADRLRADVAKQKQEAVKRETQLQNAAAKAAEEAKRDKAELALVQQECKQQKEEAVKRETQLQNAAAKAADEAKRDKEDLALVQRECKQLQVKNDNAKKDMEALRAAKDAEAKKLQQIKALIHQIWNLIGGGSEN